ncbi:MAG: NAD(P)/FAD-dependent oxidoreductase [Ahniella sp.]|nr:NAD(P)/FAD-dependent oxidoreductase [Ahniella sp.]
MSTGATDKDHDPGSAKRARVVIIGGGFGGLWATRALARAPVDITLIDRTNHHLFQPLLYQVATAGLSAPDIAAPLRHILRGQRNVTVLMAEVDRIDTGARSVHAGAQHWNYDYLVVAAGATHAYFGNDAWRDYAPGLKTLDDAFLIRSRMLSAFEHAEASTDPVEQARLLRFVVIGAGPTGVELAGTLAEIARHTLPREFRRIDPGRAEIHLIEAGPRVLSAMPESLSASAKHQLERLGVLVHVGQPVSAMDADGILLGTQRIDSATVLWAAGVAASPLGACLPVERDRAGRVRVAPDLSVPAHPEVFVIGDLASVTDGGKPVPGVAPAAKQMGRFVAERIRRRLQGKSDSAAAFRYRDFGNLATIGRLAAVVDLRGVRFSGAVAWLFWLFAHLLFLIGFRNRVIVLFQWAVSYITYQRHARVIVGAPGSRSGDEPPPS